MNISKKERAAEQNLCETHSSARLLLPEQLVSHQITDNSVRRWNHKSDSMTRITQSSLTDVNVRLNRPFPFACFGWGVCYRKRSDVKLLLLCAVSG